LKDIKAKTLYSLYPLENKRLLPRGDNAEIRRNAWLELGIRVDNYEEGPLKKLVGQIFIGRDMRRFCNYPGEIQLAEETLNLVDFQRVRLASKFKSFSY
jgi:hypothetical protein